LDFLDGFRRVAAMDERRLSESIEHIILIALADLLHQWTR
jgi:hypothetical protein